MEPYPGNEFSEKAAETFNELANFFKPRSITVCGLKESKNHHKITYLVDVDFIAPHVRIIYSDGVLHTLGLVHPM